MALDTREKRAAVGQNWFLLLLPLPDNSITAPDRAQINLLSSALTYSEAAPSGGGGSDFLATTRRRRLKMKGLFR